MNQNASFTYDLDLFFKDTLWGKIHLATAGGYVHNQIFNDPKHFENKINLKKSIYPDYEYKLNPNLEEILKLADPKLDLKKINMEKYLRDFIFYAKKGYFSREEMIHKAFIKPVEMNILKN